MAQVFFDLDTPYVYELNLTASEILAKHVSAEELPDFELFFHGRKMSRNQKLSDIKGLTEGKSLRILRKQTSRVAAPSNLRATVAALDKKMQKFNESLESRQISLFLCEKDFRKKLLNDFPLIYEEMILMNVISDYSLLTAMLHEEEGFIQQHPSLVPILEKVLADCFASSGPGDLMNMLRSALNPRRQRNANPTVAPAPRLQFTSQMLQDAFRGVINAGGGEGSSNAIQPSADEPMPEAEAAPAPQPVVNRYSTQLEQLHAMGFTNDDENIIVLDSVDGSVEAAMNLLFAMQE